MGRTIQRVNFTAIQQASKQKRVAAYARVSNGKETMLHSLSAQVSYYSSLIQKTPGWDYAGVYADEAISGTKNTRGEFQRMLADCRAGKIDMIFTKSISRFARNTVTTLQAIRELRLIGVDGTSMYPTLEDHNIMLTSNWGYHPARGDIVVLNKESFWNGLPIVKRIIAVGGDEVDIDFEAGEVTVNGETLYEPYIAEPTFKREDMEFPQTVPEGCVFVMGDNRNWSTDSRNSALGMVDERYILGHVLTIAYPFDKIGAL